MKNKHCRWCDNSFEAILSHQIYCSAECREAATKEKIAEKYQKLRVLKRVGKDRKCKSCGTNLSIYNDSILCLSCDVDQSDVAKVLKEIKKLSNGKE